MNHILEFAKFRDISLTRDEELNDNMNREFVNDARLIFDVYLEKYDKHIFLKWFDTKDHSIPDRVKGRTTFISISEFNSYIEKTIIRLFEKHINEINSDGCYALYMLENKFSIILDIKYDNLFSKYTMLFIRTITTSSPIADEIIIIDDSFF